MATKNSSKTASEVVYVAIYARYSTDFQHSTEQQIRLCREYAAEQGWVVLEDCIFVDEAKSGQALAGRESLDRMMTMAEKGEAKFHGCVVVDTSRFGRNLTDTLQLSEKLEFSEIFLYFVEDALDSRDRNFRKLFIDRGQRDEDFVRVISRKVHSAHRDRAKMGHIPGGRVYGYDNVRIEHPTKKGRWGYPIIEYVDLVLNPLESEIVRQIFEMYVRGMGYRSIARYLNDKGIPSPLQGTGSPVKRRWNSWAIADILKRDKYRGVHVWAKTKVVRNPYRKGEKKQKARPETEWERIEVPEWRIVSDKLWNAAQAEKARRQGPSWWKDGGLNLTEASRRYVLSGLMQCAMCGGSFNVVSGTGPSLRYGCIGHRYRGNCKNKLTILKRVLEARLLTAIANNLQDAGLRDQLAQEFHVQLVSGWEERARKAQKVTSSLPQLRERKRALEADAGGIGIALRSLPNSRTLLDQLKSIEGELHAVEEMLAMPTEPAEQPLPLEAIQEFVERKTGDFVSLLAGDPERTKLELRKRIGKLVMNPTYTAEGPVYVVTGDLSLFAEGENVDCEVSSPGNLTVYNSCNIPFEVQIATKHPRFRRLAA